MTVELRPLELRDLDAIERDRARVVPDAVVALDVRGRAREADARSASAPSTPTPARLVGYLDHLALRRRLARDERRRRPRLPRAAGSRTTLLERLFELTARRRAPRLHARGARLERRARSRSTSGSASSARGVRRGYYTDNREDALIMWQRPRRRPSAAERRMILGHRDVLRRDRGGARHRRRARSARTSSPRRPSCTRATAASCPRSPRGATSSSSSPVVREALGEAGATLDDVEPVAVTQGPGLIGALLVGLSAAKALAWARAAAARRRSTTCTATSPRSTSSPTRSSRRSSACSRAAGTRCCSTCATAAGYAVLGTTLDDAAGEAFDKGARLLGLGYPGRRARSTGSRARATPRRSPSRSRACPGSTSRSRA